MKRRLVDVLQCPACGASLDLHAIREAGEEVQHAVASPRCSRQCALLGISVPEGLRTGMVFDCTSCYSRDVTDGFLACSSCRILYPIIDGVPRLLRQSYADYESFFREHVDTIRQVAGQERLLEKIGKVDPAVFDARSRDSFSVQWEQYNYTDRTWFKDDVALRQHEFLQSLALRAEDLRGTLILDAGCGNGRLTASVARHGAEVVGMDFSRSVVRANENRRAIAGEHAPFVHFLQGNIMEPPLRPESFDHIHSSGVLHHTPDTWRAFASFLKLGRPGGRVYVQLYRRRELWVRLVNTPLRFVTSRLPVRLLYKLCYLMVPVHTGLVLLVAKARGEISPIREASRRERAISLFDHLSPRYQYRYTPEQVRRRFVDAGLQSVTDVTFPNEARHMVAFVGVKNGRSGAPQSVSPTTDPHRTAHGAPSDATMRS
jgi:2-polyprenyl-3-methyl-5-hydroxy-6-metoxy-1,4-benzoquinol methylase/uncharacterized protein YbaR (Trm112 family)